MTRFQPLKAIAVSTTMLMSISLAACGGGSDSSSGVQDGEVIFGLSSVLSGPYASYSDFSEGVKMYFDAQNEAGGVNDLEFNYVEEDNAFTPAQSVQAFRALAAEKVFAIIPAGTPAVTSTKDLAEQLDVPVVGTADGDLFTPPEDNVFGLNARYTSLARFDAQFIMEELDTPEFALAYEDDAVGIPARDVVPDFVEANGGSLLASVPIDAAGTDYSAQAQKLKDSGATVVQGFIGTTAFAGLQKAAATIDYRPTWVTFFTQLTPAYPELAGDLADGVYAHSFLEQEGPALDAFKDAAEKYDPQLADSFLAQLGWSAGAVAVEGVKRATDGGEELTQDGFVTALSEFVDVSAGLLPAVTYDSESHAGSTSAAMYQYDGGTIKQVLDYTPLPSD